MLAVYAAIVLIPPYGLALLALLAVGSWFARRHVLVWVVVPFVVAHAVLARQDPRFLIPLLYVFGPWLGVCVDRLPQRLRDWLDRWRRTAFGRANVAVFCAVNVLALLVASVVPVNDRIRLDRWQWDERGRQSIVYTVGAPTSGLPKNVTNSFYRTDVVMLPFTTLAQGRAAPGRAPVFVYYEGPETPAALSALGCRPVLRTFPVWLAERSLFRRLTNITVATICRLGDT